MVRLEGAVNTTASSVRSNTSRGWRGGGGEEAGELGPCALLLGGSGPPPSSSALLLGGSDPPPSSRDDFRRAGGVPSNMCGRSWLEIALKKQQRESEGEDAERRLLRHEEDRSGFS